MIQRDAVSEEDLRFIFFHGQPLVFEAFPNRLVPKVIRRLFRPEVACDSNKECVVEKFHFCSKHFTKQLSIELYSSTRRHFYGYEFYGRPATTSEHAKVGPYKVIVRLEDPVCGVAAVPSFIVASKRTTMVLVPEFAVEVFGFLDRIHIGSSLLANRRMHDCLTDAKGILPVHQLSCELQKEQLGFDYDIWACRYNTYYWLRLHHFQRDLPYNDAREFKLCDEMSPQEECALVLRYLSNSYIVGFADDRCAGSPHPKDENLSSFFLRMLGALAAQNVAVGRLRLGGFGACVRDYCALERAFDGQLPITALRVSLKESKFVGLVKITDFFRYSGVQRLKELCLSLDVSRDNSPSRTGPTPNPLWTDGIHQLRNCEKYEVHHEGRRIRSAVPMRLVQFCEKFERGEVSETVKHFVFRAYTDVEVAFPFNADNLVASRVAVVAENRWAHVGRYEFDVYHFRNAVNAKSLTAIVGHGLGKGDGTVLHLLGGTVYPDALLTFRDSESHCNRYVVLNDFY
ncbi:hypothetical protein AAVH_30851 [Aphelenchoides avenae]|nr:hypothetical protein AAVH_30851 [Aphelenchus avenae]